jgi:hypothetical protein
MPHGAAERDRSPALADPRLYPVAGNFLPLGQRLRVILIIVVFAAEFV